MYKLSGANRILLFNLTNRRYYWLVTNASHLDIQPLPPTKFGSAPLILGLKVHRNIHTYIWLYAILLPQGGLDDQVVDIVWMPMSFLLFWKSTIVSLDIAYTCLSVRDVKLSALLILLMLRLVTCGLSRKRLESSLSTITKHLLLRLQSR